MSKNKNFKGPVTAQTVQPHVVLDRSGKLIKSFESSHEAQKLVEQLNGIWKAYSKTWRGKVEDLRLKARQGDRKAASELIKELTKEDQIPDCGFNLDGAV